jgi:hypothetical protein
MKISPIPFSTDMVRAVIDNRKSQTRRLKGLEQINVRPDEWEVRTVGRLNLPGHKHHGKFGAHFHNHQTLGLSVFVPCPYGGPGDLLYVRETWRPGHFGTFGYKADFADSVTGWKPSIHMPRRGSRITLELSNLRVERLQNISQQDAIEEGIRKEPFDCDYRGFFRALWNSLNEKRGYGWDVNPWAWALDFPGKVYRENIDSYIYKRAVL